MTNERKIGSITMRTTSDLLAFLDSFAEDLNSNREAGSKKVSRTEAITILIELGRKEYLAKKKTKLDK